MTSDAGQCWSVTFLWQNATEMSKQSIGRPCHKWTPSQVAFLVNRFHQQDLEKEHPMTDTSGPNLPEPFAYYDPSLSSWRTFQLSLEHPNGELFSQTWPKQGTMRSGRLYEHQTWEPPTVESVFSWLLPTPKALEAPSTTAKNTNPTSYRRYDTLTDTVKLLPTPRARGDAGPKDHGNGGFLEVEVAKLSGDLTPARSDVGNDSQGRPQNPQTTKGDSAYNLWSG
jgi:hypothetical protein